MFFIASSLLVDGSPKIIPSFANISCAPSFITPSSTTSAATLEEALTTFFRVPRLSCHKMNHP